MDSGDAVFDERFFVMARSGERVVAAFEENARRRLPKNFGAPEATPPRNLYALTNRQREVYTALMLSVNRDEDALDGLITENIRCASVNMPAWRHRWPQSFNDDVVKACNADAEKLEEILFLIAAARHGNVLKPKPVDVESDDAREDTHRRRGFGEGILIDVDDELVLWMPRPEETFTLFSSEQVDRMSTTPGRVATAVNSVDLRITSSGAVSGYLNGGRFLDTLYRAASKQTRRERAVANPAESCLAIAAETRFSRTWIYQLRKVAGLPNPKSTEIENRATAVRFLKPCGLTQRQIFIKTGMSQKQVRRVWK